MTAARRTGPAGQINFPGARARKNIHRSLFLAASGLSFLFTWSLILFAILLDPAIPVTVHHGLPIKALIAPFTTFLAMPLILIMPLDILGLPQRRGLMRSAKRVFLAPFYPVPFCDIVLADVFTSYSRPLAEIILAFAWIFGTIFRVGVPSSHAWHKINPFILALPPLWRLLQCLRAYHTDRKPRHLANAVKYSSSFPVIFISAQISSFQVDSPFFSYWLIAAFINMSISIYWDFVQDFGLCYFHSGVKYPGLRTYLIYRSVGRLIALLTLGAIATGSVFFFWLRRTLPYYPAETVAAFYEALATFYRPVFFVILAIWCAGLNAHFLNRSGISLSLAFQIETLYVHPWMYYMAMAFDFAARAAWSYRLTTSFKDFPEASVLLLQTIESFRRCIWIFFRVEHRMLADNLFRKEILLQPGAGGPQRPMPSLSSANAHSEGTGATPLIISTGAGLGAHAHDSPGGSPLAEAPLPHWN
ncbi:hypothetical protein H696_05588 [Fonticula alba]|uniref:EXS domain-containing protein n=1 Tax=Fonticula alba TaxID=691883 RepID=A0A058Z1Q0_FONAL|nr:hypothetical protein H696_05588 [Fonticula alba]KCV67858.1 hypothetical protein H696_05588 [Fonticula alba]|eukprot:XP_009497678.1 hypothetical protein H696_05588 [Fonticula alba]